MATWIDDRSAPPKPISKRGKGIGCLLLIALYFCAAFSIRSVSEDKHSHAVRVSLPLLLGYGWMAYPGENFDPAKVVWGNLSTAVGVADGQVVFVRTHQGDYALRIFDQTLEPERAKYEFVSVGQKGPIHEGVADGTRPIELPNRHLEWSGAQAGHGFLYLSDRFTLGLKNPYQFGGPFRSGDVKQFEDGLPSGVQFSSLAWKVNEINGVKFDDTGFMQ